ncbi:cupin domain-containing protein [Halobacillus fulvus]|nr:cupin domain-containing protein [Halobacillus fulvus]
MNKQAEEIIEHLALEPHPEGGFYKPTNASDEVLTADPVMDKFGAERRLYTNIYFLLRSEDISHLHRLRSDECWYFHSGSGLTIHMIHPDGRYEEVSLGMDYKNGAVPQYTVPKGTIFGSSVNCEDSYALVSCMVSPGFDFEDFELFTQEELLKDYPDHGEKIKKLAYEKLPE